MKCINLRAVALLLLDLIMAVHHAINMKMSVVGHIRWITSASGLLSRVCIPDYCVVHISDMAMQTAPGRHSPGKDEEAS